MRGFVGKADNFVFNRGAVARANSFNDTGIHGRLFEAITNKIMGLFIGMGDVTARLFWMLFGAAHEGKHGGGGVAKLLFHGAEINGSTINARRRARFKSIDAEWEVAQTGGEGLGRRVARTACLIVF